MRIPSDEQGQYWPWISRPEADTLLYFVQLIETLLNNQSPDGLRVVSLDSYHRLREVERTWMEATVASIQINFSALFEELQAYLSRDPIVTHEFASEWTAIVPRLKSAGGRPENAVEGVRFLAAKLAPAYLRKCRDYLVEATRHGRPRNRRDFRFVTENFCSHLLNAGYHPESIHFRVRRTFFERNLEQSPERELQSFFAYFPHQSRRKYRVGITVSEDFSELLEARPEFTHVSRKDWPEGWAARSRSERKPQPSFFSWETEALDFVDARHLCEAHLARVRAVAYTAKPYAKLEWDPFIVVSGIGGPATVLREPADSLRWGRGRMVSGPRDSKARFELFLDRPWAEADRNRLTNALTTYASAFHSESLASQLLSLWSSLEGLLPAPHGSGSRIAFFSRDVVACLEQRALHRHVSAIHEGLNTNYRESYTAILGRVVFPLSDHASRLAAIFCLRENDGLRTEIGQLCGANPLARQRLHELFDESGKTGDLARMIQQKSVKVGWQLDRIYRERNRIVHRASPSANVETLVLTLNAYILGVFDALLFVGKDARADVGLDDLFAELRITREACERWAAANSGEALDADRLLVLLRAMP